MENIDNLASIIITFIGSGLVAGFTAGLLGIGGGIIFVPMFYFVFGNLLHIPESTAIVMATSSSLLTMIPTSYTSCMSHYKKGNIDVSILKSWLPFLLTGVIIGSITSSLHGGKWLTILFGSILFLSALNMLFFSKLFSKKRNLPKLLPGQAIIASTISTVSVLLGIGGGTLTVPTLSFFNYDTKKAVGISSAVGFIICLPGAIVHLIADIISDVKIENAPPLTIGYTCILAVLFVIPFSVITAPLGVKVNKALPEIIIKRIFAILLVFTSIKMIVSVF